MNIAIWIIIGYLILCLGIAYYSYRKRGNSLEDFFLGRRQTGAFIGFMTFSATLYSSFMLVGMPGFFYTHGIGAWAFVMFADVLMAVLLYFVGRKMWEISKEKGIITPTEFVEKRYNRVVGITAVVISFVFLLPYISTQIIGAGIILGSVIGLPPLVLSLIIAIIIFIYSELGGMRSVSWTDALQGSILVFVSLVVMLGVISHFGGVASMFSSLSEQTDVLSIPGPNGYFTLPMLFSFFLMIFLMPVTQPQLSMRFFILKDKKALRTMMFAIPVFAVLAIVPTMFVGFGARLLDPALASGDLALSTVLGLFPPVIVAIAIVGVIAASMSTADSQVLALSSLVTRDLFRGKIRTARLSMFIIIGLAVLIAVQPPKLIVTLSILSFAGTLQLAPAMIGGLFWKKGNSTGALASMLSGIAIMVLYQWFWTSPMGFHPAFWGFIAATVTYILGSYIR